ncbi:MULTISPECIES: TraX family protein [Clostridium]|nr:MULTISPECIES: TraX family protein [Clostridium]MBY6810864.1 hypothetical protein [Clostridium botulinum]MBY6824332.1 hypothetical protein [Clostridium botulinum]MBY6834786.1 hypothetical protein [Clostridium botulinum]MBY6973169.1 hypothetical protein [Clostridium botulinum]
MFRVVRRLTIAIMCYMVVKGYNQTENIKKYLARMFIFALISYVPYVFFHTGKISLFFGENQIQTSAMWPLFLGLVAVCILDSHKIKKPLKIILLIFTCLLSMPGDWSIFAVIWINGFQVFYGNRKKQLILYGVLAMFIVLSTYIICVINGTSYWNKEIYQFGLLIAVPILLKYNGELGKYKYMKWIFYMYYHLHMIVLGMISIAFKG